MITAPIANLILLILTSSTYPRLVTIYSYTEINKQQPPQQKLKKARNQTDRSTDLSDRIVEDVFDGVVVYEIDLLRVFAGRL